MEAINKMGENGDSKEHDSKGKSLGRKYKGVLVSCEKKWLWRNSKGYYRNFGWISKEIIRRIRKIGGGMKMSKTN